MRLIYLLFGLLAVINCESASQIFKNMTEIPGFIELDNKGDNLFYWLFPSQNNASTSPIVVWLTGGPGCSSELAIFYENGPFKINDDLSLKLNPYSWNLHANMLYVDQPVGTGYSYGPNLVNNEDEVAQDFYKFITKFFAKYPQYTSNRPFFIVGESYAGHYVPAISAYIRKQNNPQIQLVASAIGNGLVDPYLQYPAYPVFSLQNKLIDQSEYNELVPDFNYCQNLIGQGSSYAFYYCNEIVDEITGDPSRFNVYNVKEPCSYPPLCYNFDNLAKFLNRTDVIAALGVQQQASSWASCNSSVYQHLEDDWMNNLAPKVQYLLENGVRVLVYSGTLDFICNWKGGEDWTNGFNWTYTSQFQQATYTNWTLTGENSPSGQYKHYDKLTFMKVYEAGHMVPMDQPKAALALLTEFFQGFSNEYEKENNIKFYQ